MFRAASHRRRRSAPACSPSSGFRSMAPLVSSRGCSPTGCRASPVGRRRAYRLLLAEVNDNVVDGAALLERAMTWSRSSLVYQFAFGVGSLSVRSLRLPRCPTNALLKTGPARRSCRRAPEPPARLILRGRPLRTCPRTARIPSRATADHGSVLQRAFRQRAALCEHDARARRYARAVERGADRGRRGGHAHRVSGTSRESATVVNDSGHR